MILYGKINYEFKIQPENETIKVNSVRKNNKKILPFEPDAN